MIHSEGTNIRLQLKHKITLIGDELFMTAFVILMLSFKFLLLFSFELNETALKLMQLLG